MWNFRTVGTTEDSTKFQEKRKTGQESDNRFPENNIKSWKTVVQCFPSSEGKGIILNLYPWTNCCPNMRENKGIFRHTRWTFIYHVAFLRKHGGLCSTWRMEKIRKGKTWEMERVKYNLWEMKKGDRSYDSSASGLGKKHFRWESKIESSRRHFQNYNKNWHITWCVRMY